MLTNLFFLLFYLELATTGALLQVIQSPAEISQIKIGVSVPLSGPVSSYGRYCLQGMLLRSEMDPNIKLVIEDNEGNPNDVTLILKEFAAKGISIAIGPVTSSNAVVAGIEGKTHRIIIVLPAATNTTVTKVSPLLFRTCFTDRQQGIAIAEFLFFKLGKRELQIISDTGNIYSTSLAVYVKYKFSSLGGKTKLIEIDDKTNLEELAGKFSSGTIFLPLYYESAKSIIKKARENGSTATFVGADGWDAPELFEALKGDNIPAYFSTHYFVGNNDKSKEFDSLYIKKYNTLPNTFVALGFDAMNIVLTAIKNAKTLNISDILPALLEIKKFEGVTGTFSYAGKRDPQKQVFIVRVQGGKPSLFAKISPSEFN